MIDQQKGLCTNFLFQCTLVMFIGVMVQGKLRLYTMVNIMAIGVHLELAL